MVLTNQRQGQENINLWMKLKQMVLQIVIKRLTPWRQTKASSCTERPYKTHSSTTYPSVQASTVVPSMNLSRTWAAGDARGRTRDCTQGSVTAWMMKTVKHRMAVTAGRKCAQLSRVTIYPCTRPRRQSHLAENTENEQTRCPHTDSNFPRKHRGSNRVGRAPRWPSPATRSTPSPTAQIHPPTPSTLTSEQTGTNWYRSWWNRSTGRTSSTGAASPVYSTPVQISARSEILHRECHCDTPGDVPPWGGQTVSMHSPGHTAVVEELSGPGDSREPLLHLSSVQPVSSSRLDTLYP